MAIQFPFQFDQRYQPGSIPQFGSFGPPNISSMLQSSISKLADPMVARLRELEVVNKAAALNRETSDIFKQPTGPTPPGAAAPASAAPIQTSSSGSPAGDASSGALSGGVGSNQVRNVFMDTVKSGGLTNPYALAAVQATGDRETGWSPGRLTSSWDDLGKPSGGALSWRAERLDKMRQLTAGSGNPAEAQAQFFLNEDPKLIADLQNARSPEHANALMANAWRFKGYNQPSNAEYQARLALTRQYAAQTPEQAPTTSFAPPVAPAPTPSAAAAVGPPGGTPAYSGGNPSMPLPQRGAPDPRAAQQVASLDPAAGTGSIRDPAPEVAPRRVPTQAVGPDGQPLPPAQQPAQPLPSGGPPNEQPDPPPPPPVQPPPPPVPPVQPPPPVQQAALPTPAVPASQQVAPSGVAPIAAAPVPPGQIAMGVPSPQAPQRMAQAPQQQAPQRAAPIDQTADRFWEAVGRNAQTPEQALFANAKRLELRQPKTTYTNVDGVLVAHDERGNVVPVYGDKNKGAPTVEVGESKGRMQWNPKTGLYDIPVGTPQPGALTKQQFDQEDTLRTKFAADPETKKYFTTNNTYQLLRSSADSGTGVGDVSMIYQYMKMLDPDTGIKEGEVALAQQTGNLPDRIVTMYNKLVTGERFSDKQRADFVNEAGRLLQVRHNNVNRAADKYRKIAKDFTLNPDRVVQIDPYEYKPWIPPTDPRTGQPRSDPGGREAERAAQAHGSAQNPVDLSQSTPDAARRTLRTLPDGAWWVGADGVPRQKGGAP